MEKLVNQWRFFWVPLLEFWSKHTENMPCMWGWVFHWGFSSFHSRKRQSCLHETPKPHLCWLGKKRFWSWVDQCLLKKTLLGELNAQKVMAGDPLFDPRENSQTYWRINHFVPEFGTHRNPSFGVYPWIESDRPPAVTWPKENLNDDDVDHLGSRKTPQVAPGCNGDHQDDISFFWLGNLYKASWLPLASWQKGG